MGGRVSVTEVYIAVLVPLLRDAIATAVERCARLALIGATDGRTTALKDIDGAGHCVALVDLALDDAPDLRLLRELAGLPGRPRVLAMGDSGDGSVVYDVLAAGAIGYLRTADLRESDLLGGIVAAGRDELVLAAPLQQALARHIHGRGCASSFRLSEREYEVLTLITQGRSVPEIAANLHLSVGTIKAYTCRIYDKLDVHDRAAACAVAIRHGLIT
jgi:two-component system, NarL family, nitrate/nitrite response regulator NarL